MRFFLVLLVATAVFASLLSPGIAKKTFRSGAVAEKGEKAKHSMAMAKVGNDDEDEGEEQGEEGEGQEQALPTVDEQLQGAAKPNYNMVTFQQLGSTCCWFLAVVEGWRRSGFIQQSMEEGTTIKPDKTWKFTDGTITVEGTFAGSRSNIPKWQRIFQKYAKAKVPTSDCYQGQLSGDTTPYQKTFLTTGQSSCGKAQMEAIVSSVYQGLSKNNQKTATLKAGTPLVTWLKGQTGFTPTVPGRVITVTKKGSSKSPSHEITVVSIAAGGKVKTFNGYESITTRTVDYTCRTKFCKGPNKKRLKKKGLLSGPSLSDSGAAEWTFS